MHRVALFAISPSPSTNSYWSAIIMNDEMIVSVRPGRRSTGDASLNDHALQSQAQAQRRNTMLACPAQRAKSTANTTNAEASGTTITSTPTKLAGSLRASRTCPACPANIPTRALFANHRVIASDTDRYASCRSMYLPTGGLKAVLRREPRQNSFVSNRRRGRTIRALDEVGVEASRCISGTL